MIASISMESKASPAQNFFTPLESLLNMQQLQQMICEYFKTTFE